MLMKSLNGAGQYLRALPDEEVVPMVAAQWVDAGLLVGGDGHEASPFVRAAVHAAKTSLVRASRLLVCASPGSVPLVSLQRYGCKCRARSVRLSLRQSMPVPCIPVPCRS